MLVRSMSLSLSDLDDCGSILSAECPDFQLPDKILTPEVDEPITDIQLQDKCAPPELAEVPPLSEPKSINKESDQECERWWLTLSKEQQQDLEQFISERENQRSCPTNVRTRSAKRASSFSSSASSFFSSYSSGFAPTSPLRRIPSSASFSALLLASSSASPTPAPPFPFSDQQYMWARNHLSSPARIEEKQMEAWWSSLTANKRQHIEKFIADTHSADPNRTERALLACTKKFSLSESQYYWVLFRLNSAEGEEQGERNRQLECDPDLAGKHFFKNGHTFHASTTVNLLGPATISVVRRVDKQKLHLTKSGSVCIRVEEPGPFTVYLRDFRLNLNNVKAQFRIEAEMCGAVFVTGWCTVHPRPPPSRKVAAAGGGAASQSSLTGAESSEDAVSGTPTKRRKRASAEPSSPPSAIKETPPLSSRSPLIGNLTDLVSPPPLGRRKQSALQFLSNVAVDQLEGH